MDLVYAFWQSYGIFILTLTQVVGIFVLFVLVHKINKLKKRMDGVIQKADKYLKFILEDEKENSTEGRSKGVHDLPSRREPAGLDEDSQNQLISEVLQQIFP